MPKCQPWSIDISLFFLSLGALMTQPTDPTLDAAMRIISRYGMRRATMADLAREAGVSRQTLYDRFGDKDGIMAAVIRSMAVQTCHKTRTAFAQANDLSDKIDAYYNIAVWPIFEIIKTLPDAADLEQGMGSASQLASSEAETEKQALLAEMLRDQLSATCPPPEHVAAFLEQASSRAKMSSTSRENLEQFLSVLKAAVLAMARS